MLRDEQTNSIWAHTEGLAVDGPLKGTILQHHVCFQTTCEEWLKLHPDSDVLVYPMNEMHRDGRHGHGARDYIGREGIRAGRAFGLIPEGLDERLPESDLVLGIRHKVCDIAYRLRDVHRSGGVIQDKLGEDLIVVWGPRFDSHFMAAYSRDLEELGTLTFHSRGEEIWDLETGCHWNLEGKAVKGPLEGASLQPLDFLFCQWHAWSNFHPESRIFQTSEYLSPDQLQTDRFSMLLNSLVTAGYRLEIEDQVIVALLPNMSQSGLFVRINGDPFVIYYVEDILGAHEYCFTQDHLIHIGNYVMQSMPDKRYSDTAQMKPLPSDEIAWSKLLEDSYFKEHLETSLGAVSSGESDLTVSFPILLDGIREKGFILEDIVQLDRRRLRVNAVNGYEVRINGSPFLVYRFKDLQSAVNYSKKQSHSIYIGNYVFRDDPEVQYKHMGLKSIDLPEEKIEWSPLLEDEYFIEALRELIFA